MAEHWWSYIYSIISCPGQFNTQQLLLSYACIEFKIHFNSIVMIIIIVILIQLARLFIQSCSVLLVAAIISTFSGFIMSIPGICGRCIFVFGSLYAFLAG